MMIPNNQFETWVMQLHLLSRKTNNIAGKIHNFERQSTKRSNKDTRLNNANASINWEIRVLILRVIYSICYKRNTISNERVNIVIKTYLVVFKKMFFICKLNATKYLLYSYVLVGAYFIKLITE